MGDGYWEKHRGTVMICTECFDKKEQERQQNILKVKLNLLATLNVHGKGYRIRFSKLKDNQTPLLKLVKPHFHASMMYKLNDNQVFGGLKGLPS